MPRPTRIVLLLALSVSPVLPVSPVPPVAAQHQDSTASTTRCPDRFSPVRDSTGAAPRCRRVAVLWVVTACADSAYATYEARPGADACLPTSLPGVGTAPGVRGSRAVVCAGSATGYAVVRDRVGDRDRCEREHTTFSPPIRQSSR